jgi:hypothetical protein
MKRLPKSKHLEQDQGQVVDVELTRGHCLILKELRWEVEVAREVKEVIGMERLGGLANGKVILFQRRLKLKSKIFVDKNVFRY